MKVGKAIKELRKEYDLSQNQLAIRSSLNRGYVYKLENDHISPSIDMLEKVAAVIGIKVSDIIIKAEALNIDD